MTDPETDGADPPRRPRARVPVALVLADSPAAATAAGALVDEDATVVVGGGPPIAGDVAAARVVISGDLHDEGWVTSAFERAEDLLAPGGRVLLVIPAGEALPTTGPADLPNSVASRWRMVGWIAEHPTAAVVLARSVDDDGDVSTTTGFRLAQVAVHLYRHPDDLAGLDAGTFQALRRPSPPPTADDDESELLALRRQLDAYRYSKLGRLTTVYWNWRRRWGR